MAGASSVWPETFVCSPTWRCTIVASIRGTGRKEPTMAATYDLKHGANGEKYRFNLKAANGEVVLVSRAMRARRARSTASSR